MSELGTLDEATDPALARERRAAALVDAALEQPTRERAAWLDHACGDDDVLRTIAQRWLDAAEASEGTDAVSALVGPAFEALRPTLTDDGLPVGTLLGPWRLGAPLGEGGMGTVHEAHRADGAFEKRVAIKLVRTAWRSPALIRQFQRERTLLARLEHPGIARVLDAGVSDAGVPFLVMEYVDGQPITTWCDARRATVRERVRLVAAACDAVQAAHAQLIVHCDLKPSNLLVTPDGHVKLLDFGIAHALQAGDGTPDEPTLALTPAYASPEQRRGEPATIASDVYALGAVLQRLLTGATLSPDLIAIMQRALAVAPADRYPTVDALHRDLDAWLDHRPVSARPLSGLARAVRFVRRHTLTVSLGAITLLVGIAGAGLTLWQAQRAAREAQLATEINDALLTVLAAGPAHARCAACSTPPAIARHRCSRAPTRA
ncbi:MAG: serine/threonine protein kinase [Gemmatimonadaceae bacterium]|nr:serine/threonine protein kinase [Gemmatimonadaceae bacterium]